ncbi:MAG: outer membrane protein assembly factor BamE [Gammaproteobacteria bacterium]|nr:outer membrane protein assembly factor BamE [Gammaproteobacteria bacterium]
MSSNGSSAVSPKATTLQRVGVGLLAPLLFALGGCAHKIEVQQGNVVTQEQLQQLQQGMSKDEVITVFGSPLLQDPFHPNRWDYQFSLAHGGKSGERSDRYGLTLLFQENRVSEIITKGKIPLSADTIVR